MAKIDFSTALFVALGNKRKADFELYIIQQEIANGNRAFMVSSLVSVLEKCDEAQDKVWVELRRIMRKEPISDSPDLVVTHKFTPTDKAPRYGIQINHLVVRTTQERIRDFLAKAPKAVGPLQNIA